MQVEAIKTKNFEEASRLMPSKIEQVFEQPKVKELVLAIGIEKVALQLEFELIKLASLMSVGGNLNRAQIIFVANQLIEHFPNESLADFKICFQRGAIGQYGDIQRMDGITIRNWMTKYLDEKYEVMELKIKKEKEFSESVDFHKVDFHKMVDNNEVTKSWLRKWKEAIESTPGLVVTPLTENEIKIEGREKPSKKKVVRSTPASYKHEMELRSRWGRLHHDLYSGNKLSNWIPFEQWIKENNY